MVSKNKTLCAFKLSKFIYNSEINIGIIYSTMHILYLISAYVLALVIIVSLIGIIVESLLIAGVLRPKNDVYIRTWFWLAGFTITFSLLLAISFLLHNLGTFYIGDSWFMNGMCALADIVFFYIPEYFLGPRLQPVLHALLIIGHFTIPILHALSFYVVYSFYKHRHIYLYNQALLQKIK